MAVVVPALIQYLLEPQGVLKPGIHPLPVEGNSSVRRVAETAKIKSNQIKPSVVGYVECGRCAVCGLVAQTSHPEKPFGREGSE